MKVTGVDVYAVRLTQLRATTISGDRVIDHQDSTIVAVRSDEGVSGWGEAAPWGPAYLPMTAGTVRAALDVIAPAILGADPRNVNAVNARMLRTVRGQEPARHAIDVACWDLLARSLGAPLFELLGGRVTHPLPTAGFIHRDGDVPYDQRIADLRVAGHPHFEVKASGDPSADAMLVRRLVDLMRPHERLKIDANGGWSVAGAAEVMAEAPPQVLFEQPCATYAQCRQLRQRRPNPIALDEVIVTVDDLVRAIVDGVADVINVKLARVGGISPARTMTDLCARHGIPVIVQCVGGSELSSAAIAHLASTIPNEQLMSVWDGTQMLSTRTGAGHHHDAVSMWPSTEPGLGIDPDPAALGQPILTYRV